MIKLPVFIYGLLICFGLLISYIQAEVPSDGVIPIISKYGVYTVRVESMSQDADGNNALNSTSGTDMMLALYSSSHFLAKKCLGFIDSNLTGSDELNTDASHTSLYFSASAYIASLNFTFDSSQWITSSSSVIYAESFGCNSNAYNYGYGSGGLLGLGFADRNSFIKETSFSVFLKPDGDGGSLNFPRDLTRVNSTAQVTTLVADENWWLPSPLAIKIAEYNILPQKPPTYQVILDINTNAITVSYDLYVQILNYLEPYVFKCIDMSLPLCYNKTSIDKFPTIRLIYFSETLYIPPQVYVESVDPERNQVRLILRALRGSLYGTSYTTGLVSDPIILGSNFMKYFYPTFDITEASVSFYDLYGLLNVSPIDNGSTGPVTPGNSSSGNTTSPTNSTSDNTVVPDSSKSTTTQPLNTTTIVIVVSLSIIFIFLVCLFYYHQYLSPGSKIRKLTLDRNLSQCNLTELIPTTTSTKSSVQLSASKHLYPKGRTEK